MILTIIRKAGSITVLGAKKLPDFPIPWLLIGVNSWEFWTVLQTYICCCQL